jgi:hypothetical protein
MRRRMGISYMSVLLFFCFLVVSVVHFISQKHWNNMIRDLENSNHQLLWTTGNQSRAIKELRKDLGLDKDKYDQFARERLSSRRSREYEKWRTYRDKALNSLTEEQRLALSRREGALIRLPDGEFYFIGKSGENLKAVLNYELVEDDVIPEEIDLVSLERGYIWNAIRLSRSSEERRSVNRNEAVILRDESGQYYFITPKK